MSRYGEIVSIYLLPEFMGKGYGTKLLQAAVDSLVNDGFLDLFLWVLEDNAPARRFYKKFGFKESGNFLIATFDGKDLKEIQYI